MLAPDQIRARLRAIRISHIQLDPNGICNCACWYCPVAYEGNPKPFRHNMTLDEFQRLLDRLDEAKGSLINPALSHIWTSHFNETLVHPSWSLLYQELAKRGWTTTTLSNGIALTPRNIRLLEELTPKPSATIKINCPAADADTWAKLTGRPRRLFAQIEENLAALAASPVLAPVTTLHVNSVPPGDIGVTFGARAPLPPAELIANGIRAAKTWQKRFPTLKVGNMPLIDRAESMPEALLETRKLPAPTGCSHLRPGGLNFAGLHIAPTGDLFLCCMDHRMEYSYGNLFEKPLRELWHSDAHVAMLARALRGICTRCSFAFSDDVTLPPQHSLARF
jgi:sulfatase maturation enzyme AslB (radical SAM superfamily)